MLPAPGSTIPVFKKKEGQLCAREGAELDLFGQKYEADPLVRVERIPPSGDTRQEI